MCIPVTVTGGVELTPKPVFQDAWIEVNGVRYDANTTVEVDSGATIVFKAVIVNQGADGTVYLYVYDAKTGKYVKNTSKFMRKGETWNASLSVVQKSDSDYELHVAYQTLDGKVYVVDKWGCGW